MRLALATVLLAVLASPPLAGAQTWATTRETPALREIVSLDATGETGWPFGAEDIAADGLDRFQQQESNVDIRSAYAAADTEVLWVRLYVSDTGGAGGNVLAYVFVDVDGDQDTGGPASDTLLHERFVDDPSGGGYERVVGLSANDTVIGIWSWEIDAWVPQPDPESSLVLETGTDRDPLLLLEEVHGYLQATISHAATGLDDRCEAVLFVRTWNDVPSLDYGDINVGERAPCVPADGDGDRVPDVLDGLPCDAADDCPGDGVCVDGFCLPGNPCESDADCRPDETCRDGDCVPTGGDPCTTDADCGDLVCVNDACGPCEPPGDPCDADRVCAPTGECIPYEDVGGDSDVDADSDSDTDGFALDEGKIQGGACNCSIPSGRTSTFSLVLGLGIALSLLFRRRHG